MGERTQDSKQSSPTDLYLPHVYKKKQTKRKGNKASTKLVLYGHSRVLYCRLYRCLNEKYRLLLRYVSPTWAKLTPHHTSLYFIFKNLAAPAACRSVGTLRFFQSVPTAFAPIAYRSPCFNSTRIRFPIGLPS